MSQRNTVGRNGSRRPPIRFEFSGYTFNNFKHNFYQLISRVTRSSLFSFLHHDIVYAYPWQSSDSYLAFNWWSSPITPCIKRPLNLSMHYCHIQYKWDTPLRNVFVLPRKWEIAIFSHLRYISVAIRGNLAIYLSELEAERSNTMSKIIVGEPLLVRYLQHRLHNFIFKKYIIYILHYKYFHALTSLLIYVGKPYAFVQMQCLHPGNFCYSKCRYNPSTHFTLS